jgi:ribonuclease P protein component
VPGRFPPSQRVRKRPEFQLIQADARRVTTPHFVLLVRARAATGTRLGITVSKKTGHSVSRSRAKRLIREAFRETRDLWDDDVDLVVILKRPLGPARLAEVVAEWRGVARNVAARVVQARKDRAERESALAPEQQTKENPGSR